jgi:hypothetical protein
MKKVIVVISILAISIGSSFGQIDNNYKSTLKKMLEVAGSESIFKASIKEIIVMFKQEETNVPDSIWSDLEKEYLKTLFNDLVDMLSPVYQKYLTETDLEKIIEFYQTPVGKKYAEYTSLSMQESMQIAQQWGKKIFQLFVDKLKEKGY